MTTQLSLYNDALLLCGERFLSSLTEEREPRRLLDHVWASGGINYCLEQGQWFFAMKTIQIDYDPSIEPPFGYNRAFQKPTDWVLTSAVTSDEFFRIPLTRYVDEAGYWYAELDTIYVRYVSNDTWYGMDMNKWPDSFREFVAAHFASRIILKLSNSEAEEKNIMDMRKALLKVAKSRSAMADSTQFSAQGNWSRSRMRGGTRRGDGGNGNTSGNLIG
jgi:hypothetical protein